MTDHDGTIFGIAALQASLHSLMYVAKAGLASPEEMDVSLEGLTSTLERLPPVLLAKTQVLVDPLLAEIKRNAEDNWKGK